MKIKEIGKFKAYYRNEDEFDRIYKEIFIKQEYKFSSSKKKPLIIDCGSHIGLSILYFKSIYPDSQIIGFEPNPENFKILQKNILLNKLKGIKIYNYALSDKPGKVNLHVSFGKENPWTWADTIVYNMWGDNDNDKKVLVKTVRLSTYINKPIDLIKMDIEGSEQLVLREVEDKLHLVKEIVMEYHGTKTGIDVNNYSVIKSVLEKNGFEVKNYSKDIIFAFPSFIANLIKTSSVFIIRATKKSAL